MTDNVVSIASYRIPVEQVPSITPDMLSAVPVDKTYFREAMIRQFHAKPKGYKKATAVRRALLLLLTKASRLDINASGEFILWANLSVKQMQPHLRAYEVSKGLDVTSYQALCNLYRRHSDKRGGIIGRDARADKEHRNFYINLALSRELQRHSLKGSGSTADSLLIEYYCCLNQS